MRILIVMDPGILVPPRGYGGHERLVALFAEQYRRLGHEVHLLVTAGSMIPSCIVHPFGREGFPPTKWDRRKAILVAWKFLHRHRRSFDLIHNFGRLAYLLPILNHPVNKIMTYGRRIDRRNIRWIEKFPHKNLVLTGCSRFLVEGVADVGDWRVVYNAIDFDKYTLRPTADANAPLMFLGRLERVKGCHLAIDAAKKAGRPLVIGGNVSRLSEEIAYFKHEIEPQIDGRQICYLGELNDEQKNFHLGRAAALLFQPDPHEAFGLVMIEAMACGTPVVAFRRASVPEVVDEGITGFTVDDVDGMVDAVGRVPTLDRSRCRAAAQSRFDAPLVARQYLEIFGAIAERTTDAHGGIGR